MKAVERQLTQERLRGNEIRIEGQKKEAGPGSVIDRLQQLRPPTALSSFGDTLSVLIRALIGRLAVGEWHQGLGHRDDTWLCWDTIFFLSLCPLNSLCFCPFFSFFVAFFFLPFLLLVSLVSSCLHKDPQILSHNQYVYSYTLCFHFIHLSFSPQKCSNKLSHTD